MDLDPRWDWDEVVNGWGEHVTWLKTCRHTEIEQVESGGEIVAHLCLTCNHQLPAEMVTAP